MANIKKIRQAMLSAGIPALWLYDELDRLYASGFLTSDGSVLILRDKAYFITDSRYIEAARETVRDAEVILCSNENRETDILKKLLSENGITELGAQDGSLCYTEYLRMQDALGVKFIPAQGITKSLREIKERFEVESIISAQRIAEKALDYVLGKLAPGMTEKEVAAELEYQMTRNGAEGLAFETICVSGSNTSRPHGVPTFNRLKIGEFVTMDFGCKVNGYCSDMTRTVALGSVTDEMRRVYETVLEAQNAGEGAAGAGVIGREMDKAARDVIEKAGYGEYFGHGLGHSVGLYIHEGPNASPRESRPLPAGTVVTCEPGIYLPGKFGVRIEDMLFITENGPENLTKAPKNLIIL
ncbi:MAG: aminopeptidase P family protein [Oscillospiraceae bacterium]|nr:aminopeptidase P family protein [Oscillospiraceae bacterium]